MGEYINQRMINAFRRLTLAEMNAEIGRDGLKTWCEELLSQYTYIASGAAYTVDGTTVLATGAGGNTRWVACGGVYTHPDYQFSVAPADTLGYKVAKCATTTNVTIATALNSGDIVDDVTLADNDVVFVGKQTAAAENGLYVVGAVPARASHYDSEAEIRGSIISVQYGSIYGGVLFKSSNLGAITVGATALTFVELTKPTKLLSSDVILYVRPSSGNDLTGDGSTGTPYKTVNRALKDITEYLTGSSYGTNRSFYIRLEASTTYTFDSLIIPELRRAGMSTTQLVFSEEGSTTTAPGANAFTVSESGTFTSNAENVHTDTAKSWTTDQLKGMFVKVKTVKSGSMPTNWAVYVPIIRNGSNWLETAWVNSTTASNDIDTYDIVSPSVVFEFNGTGIQVPLVSAYAYVGLFGIKAQNLYGIYSGISGVNSNVSGTQVYVYSSSLSNSPTGCVTPNTCVFNGAHVDLRNTSMTFRSFTASTIYYAGSSAYLYSAINQSGFDGSIGNSVFYYANIAKSARALASAKDFTLVNKNKFINFVSAIISLATSSLTSSPTVQVSGTLFFENTDFFYRTISATDKDVFITKSEGSAVVFGNEPTIGRLTFNGTTAATEYFNSSENLNALAIAPDKYKLINIQEKEYSTSTANETPVTLSLETIASGSIITYKGTVQAVSSTGVVDSWEVFGAIKNISGTTAMSGTPSENIITQEDADWSIVLQANDTTDALEIVVTGEAATAITWKVKLAFNVVNI